MNGLPRLSAAGLLRAASSLKITQLRGGATAPWVPNPEQVRVWEEGETQQRRYITKPRRIGISTALDLEDALWTWMCDRDGHRVRCGVVLHREENLKERITLMASFLKQLRRPHEASAFEIGFPNGSQIVGFTAGGNGASRSEGVQRMRYEEYAFYTAGMGSFAPSVSLGVQETICTTIDIAAPNGIAAREMWRAQNGYQKIFFPFESHEEYRSTPKELADTPLTVDERAFARDNGFSSDSAAHYWLREILPNKCEGDIITAFREYPPQERHMFQVSDSRVVMVDPPQAVVIDDACFSVFGIAGDSWRVEVYGSKHVGPRGEEQIAAHEHSGQLVCTVDTARGIEVSRSVVLVTDKRDKRILACCASDKLRYDDLARVAMETCAHFAAQQKGCKVELVVEDDGVGDATCLALERLGFPFVRFSQGTIDETTKKTNKEKCITLAKRALEAGSTTVPSELKEECDELHKDEKGRYRGRKDVVMMYGMALVWVQTNAFDPKTRDPERKEKNYYQEALQQHLASRRTRVGWGR